VTMVRAGQPNQASEAIQRARLALKGSEDRTAGLERKTKIRRNQVCCTLAVVSLFVSPLVPSLFIPASFFFLFSGSENMRLAACFARANGKRQNRGECARASANGSQRQTATAKPGISEVCRLPRLPVSCPRRFHVNLNASFSTHHTQCGNIFDFASLSFCVPLRMGVTDTAKSNRAQASHTTGSARSVDARYARVGVLSDVWRLVLVPCSSSHARRQQAMILAKC
jgi:hypothetical protein